MIGQARLLEELAKLVKRSPADATSVCARGGTYRVSRFAYEAIHQDLVQESLTVSVRVVVGKRVGVALTNTLERAALHRSLRAALEIARHAPATTPLPPLPRGHRIQSTAGYAPQTPSASATQTVRELKRLFHVCRGVGAQLAGSLATGEEELAVANSSGVSCYHASTTAGAKFVTLYRRLAGYASGVHRNLGCLDLDSLLERALKQCLHRQDPVTLPVGTYEVVLEPEAVAELMTWLGYIAFGAKSFQEKTSFLAGRMGEQVVARSLTLMDDGQNPEGLAIPFDCEGVPKQPVALIDHGTAAGMVYDTAYGLLYGHPSTGHASSPDDAEGPLPSHLFLTAGSSTREELIRSCRRGLLIPRFHYVNGLLNPREALMTGLTREGAFVIEDGKLKAPITTMRFTQSLLEALKHVRGISRERRLVADPTTDAGCAVMPTLHLAKFRFTGRSEAE